MASGSAALGRTMSYFSLFGGWLAGLLLIGVGYVVNKNRNSPTSTKVHPTTASVSPAPPPWWAGYGFMGAGVLVIIWSTVWFFIVQRNKAAAAFAGVGDVVTLLTGG